MKMKNEARGKRQEARGNEERGTRKIKRDGKGKRGECQVYYPSRGSIESPK
jgi:hypothetical protein